MHHFGHTDPQSIDEAIFLAKGYWNLPDVNQFQTEIKEIDGNWINLRQNYFYPEGGGQPSDQGFIKFKSKKFDVLDVQERDRSVWLQMDKIGFEEGVKIEALIDISRRNSLTRNHSGQHLISAAFWEELGFETTRASIHILETEVEFNKSPSLENLETILTICHEKISENLPIRSSYYSNLEIQNTNIRGGITSSFDVFRIVEIGKYDLNACGGTHVSSTGEIDILTISKIDGRRIKFLTAKDSKTTLAPLMKQVFESSRILGVPVTKISQGVADVLNLKEKYEKENLELKRELIQHQINSVSWKNISKIKYKFVRVTEIDRGKIVSLLTEELGDYYAVIYDDSGKFVMISNSEKRIQLIMKELRKSGIKGGGKGTVLMGHVDSILSLEEQVIDLLNPS